jgi:hypothetical protein
LINFLTHDFWRKRELIFRRENKTVSPDPMACDFFLTLYSGMQLLPEEKKFSIAGMATEQG